MLIQARCIKKKFEDELDQNKYIEAVRSALYKNIKIGTASGTSELLKAIGEVCDAKDSNKVNTVVTYNYDDILEHEFDRIGKTYVSLFESEESHADDENVKIFHVHGFIPRDDCVGGSKEIVFSEDEYYGLMEKPYAWGNMVQVNNLMEKTCIFVGLSMTDPNLRRLLDLITRYNPTAQTCHYVLMERNQIKIARDNSGIQRYVEESERLQEEVFGALKIRVIWLNDIKKEAPELLRRIFLPKTPKS